jgi:cyclophilin family peptidyl-prolyl cis-trans isomerase
MLQPGDDPQPPTGALDTGKEYIAVFNLDGGKEVRAKLFEDRTPMAVENFINLARVGFYNGVAFQRASEDLAQGGEAGGGSDPGYTFEAEFHPELRHDEAGILSMESAGAEVDGSEFHITLSQRADLDAYDENGEPKDCEESGVSCHVPFGRVITGISVVEQIADQSDASEESSYTIQTVEVIERIESG